MTILEAMSFIDYANAEIEFFENFAIGYHHLECSDEGIEFYDGFPFSPGHGLLVIEFIALKQFATFGASMINSETRMLSFASENMYVLETYIEFMSVQVSNSRSQL